MKNGEINNYENVPLLSTPQLEAVCHNIAKFFSLVYPNLTKDDYNSVGGEIRAIKRDEKLKNVQSFNFWHIDDNFKKYLFDYLNKSINGKPYCLYYSCYNFDTSTAKRISKNNAKCTSILPMDFDVEEEVFLEAKSILLSLGIETIDVFTGHGFQSLILLNETIYDETLIGRFTKLLVRKGFPVDPVLIDSARVLRLPYTFNYKSYDVTNKKYNKNKVAIPTLDINWTTKRYDVDTIFSLIENFKNDETVDSEEFFSNFDSSKNEEVEEVSIDYSQINLPQLATEYACIPNIMNQPKALHKILAYTPVGIRNSTLLFLVPFFKNTLGMNKDNIVEAITVWASKCYGKSDGFDSKKEVVRLLNYDFNKKAGVYTPEMVNAFGKFEFHSLNLNNKTKITNSIDFAAIHDCSFKIYLTLLLDNMLKVSKDTIKGSKKYEIDDICKLCKISRRTFFNNIKDLTTAGLVIKVTKNSAKKKGEGYYYYTNPYCSFSSGFISIEKATVRLMLECLTDGEIKLYTYLRKMINNNDNVFGSQQYLAERIGKSGPSSISKMIDSLVEKGFVSKNTIMKNGVKHCSYELLM